MAYFYKIDTQQIQSESEIRAEFPNTSFPIPFQAPEGYAPILESPVPETTTYQSAFKDGVEQDSLGNYVWAWKVVDWDFVEDVFLLKTGQKVNENYRRPSDIRNRRRKIIIY